MNRIARLLAISVCAILAVAPAFARGPLTFQERVAAQTAIERVYYNHRLWPKENPQPKPAFEQMVPKALIESKVEDTLKKCSALESFWHRPITADQLQAEMDRMAAQTKDPAMLKELFDALDNDPVLIAECLARPALADREIRSWYAYDSRFNQSQRAKAVDLFGQGRDVDWRSAGDEYLRFALEASNRHQTQETLRDSAGCELVRRVDDASFRDQLSRFSKSGDGISFDETSEAFVLARLISRSFKRAEIETVIIKKVPFTIWWQRAGARESVETTSMAMRTEENSLHLPALSADQGCTPDNWDDLASGTPHGRSNHCAVWTGTEMIVWGGLWDINYTRVYTNTGGRYNPATDTWVSMFAVPNTPSPRCNVTAVWTGSEMVVWGGYSRDGFGVYRYENTGGRYNPLSDSWTPTSTGADVPSPRGGHTAIWTGNEMIIWGGTDSSNNFLSSGARYSPYSNSWTATSNTNAPHGRELQTAVWTGSQMIIWGGYWFDGTDHYDNTGAKYTPATDSWVATSVGTNVPSGRYFHGAVWTGAQMIIWGGTSGYNMGTNTGAKYDPAGNTWTTMSWSSIDPYYTDYVKSIWTGSEMVIWCPGIGLRYNPMTDTWARLPIDNAPDATLYSSMVWTGSEAIIWGGWFSGYNNPSSTFYNTGSRYSPATDSWAKTARGGNVPEPRIGHSAIWTGTEMIVWGGIDNSFPYLFFSSGARYNPTLATWQPTSTGADVPEERMSHTAIWTGTKMIVWGGYRVYPTVIMNTGGLYDPVSDAWAPTSLGPSVPSPRSSHSAAWTGTQMIVWGGTADGSGGRYNPTTNSWLATSMGEGVPSPRSNPFAFWTGHDIIIWGGKDYAAFPDIYLNSGSRYDPSTDAWLPISMGPSVPQALRGVSAVWTGDRMIVWGGRTWQENDPIEFFNTGSSYDPANDVWTTIPATPWAPSPRSDATAVWADSRILMWGGSFMNDEGDIGGRWDGAAYDPFAGKWTGLAGSLLAPWGVSGTTVVWTGHQMILWGGSVYNNNLLGRGYSYCLGDGNLKAKAWADYGGWYATLSMGFHGSAAGGEGPYLFDWDFGDGTPHSSETEPQHTFSQPGAYTVVLEMTDGAGNRASDNSIIIDVRSLYFTITAYPDLDNGPAPLSVNFTALASDGIPPYHFFWDFGDGSKSEEANPSHTYTAQNSYNWKCIVVDARGYARTVSSWILISAPEAIAVSVNATPNNGPIPVAVSFSAEPSGGTPPYSFVWTFDAANYNYTQNPNFTFTTSGAHKWTLSVHDQAGQSCSRSGYVGATNPSSLSVTAAPHTYQVTAPLGAVFSASVVGGSPPYTFDWDFGDGAQHSTVLNPMHTYADPGTYTWQLTVTDGLANQAHASGTIRAEIAPLSLTASGTPTAGLQPLVVSLQSSKSGGLAPFLYDWDFGDGTAHSSQASANHIYSSAGTYHWTLSVTDSAAQSATATGTITVYPPGLNVSATASTSSGPAPLNVAFSSQVTGGTAPFLFDWDFDDGSPHSAEQDPSHVYTQAGSRAWHVTVTDADSHSATASGTIAVSTPASLSVYASEAPASGHAPLVVSFTSSAAGGIPPYAFSWSFGDGETGASEENATHTYGQPGTYTWTLSVTDAASATATASGQVIVSTLAPLSLSAGASPESGVAPLNVTFNASLSGGEPPYLYDWDFGDGSLHSSAPGPVHTYSAVGGFTWRLTVTDHAGQQASTSGTVTVSAPPLHLSAFAEPASGYAPLNSAFTSSVSGGVPPYTYSWEFGDGSAGASNQNPSHTYLSAGAFTWQLTVTDAASSTAQASGTVTVSAVPPPLTITGHVSPGSGPAPLTVSFSCTVSGGVGAYGYDWDFGDGSSHSTLPSASHTYHSPGTYAWALTIRDSRPVTETLTGVITVTATVPPPIVSSVVKAGSPFRLKILGSNFHPACAVSIDGTPVTVKYKDASKLVAKNCKSLVPKGVLVHIVVTNPDDGGTSAAYDFTR